MTAMHLRKPSIFAFLLGAIWTLGAIGDQAILRVFTTGFTTLNSSTPIYYFDTSSIRVQSIFTPPSEIVAYGVEQNVIYSASLISSTTVQESNADDWGNVKIPKMETLDPKTADKEGWMPVPDQNVSYTSLIGSAIAGIPSSGNSSLQITSSYFHTDCQTPVLLPFNEEYIWADPGGEEVCANNMPPLKLGGNRRINNTLIATCSIGSLMDNQWNQTYKLGSPARQILFQSTALNGIAAMNCTVQYLTAESRISCGGRNCTVTHMRPSSSALPPNFSPLENCTTAQNFYTQFTAACGPYHTIFVNYPLDSFTEGYMMIGASPVSTGNTVPAQTDLSTLSAETISDRLSRVLNTFWISSISPDYVAGAMSNFNISDPILLKINPGIQSEATILTEEFVYVCQDGWLALLIVSSGTLFIMGSIGIALKSYILFPDIFAYISSLTRVSPQFPYPTALSNVGLSDSKRTRLLNIKVRLGDVQPSENVGHIALVETEGTARMEGLRRERLYL
jgi:hypothetical protein